MDQLLHTVNRHGFSQNIYIVVKCNLYILSGYSETYNTTKNDFEIIWYCMNVEACYGLLGSI